MACVPSYEAPGTLKAKGRLMGYRPTAVQLYTACTSIRLLQLYEAVPATAYVRRSTRTRHPSLLTLRTTRLGLCSRVGQLAREASYRRPSWDLAWDESWQ